MFVTFADRLGYSIKIKYMRACLRQDAAFYDEHNPTEFPARIAEESEKIKAGMGDKAQMMIRNTATGVAGFAIAFYQGPILAAIYSVFLPFYVWANDWFRDNLMISMVQLAKSYS